MKYRPFGNKIVAKITNEEEVKSPSGIILVNKQQNEQFAKAEVVAVGKGYFTQQGALIPMEAQVGDIVYIPKTAIELPKDGNPELKSNEKYVVFQESDIMTGEIK